MRQLAHEMQAPITSLELRLAALRDSSSQTDLAESCLRELESMKRLVAGFLELDAPPLEPAPTELSCVLETVESRFRPIADNAGVELRTGPGELTAVCDARATERILSNLVDNAIKFSRRKGRVDVSLRAGDGIVEVTVRDEGIGIAPDARSLVFEPFYRVDREAPGSGLGLAICLRLAEAQGAGLRCESELGAGTSFILTLPAK